MNTIYFAKLKFCPYCLKDIHVMSQSPISKKVAIGNIISISRDHFLKCKGKQKTKKAMVDIEENTKNKQHTNVYISRKTDSIII